MDERITVFIENLRKHMEGLPPEEIREAEKYYEEYLFDALDAGKDLDAILTQLDSPQKIAAMIKTESSILRTQKNPGLRNFTRVLRNAFQIVTAPLAVLVLTMFVIVSLSLVVAFFAVSLVTFAGAVVFAFGLAYQAFTASSQNTMEILGALGLGLLGAGTLLLISYLFFKLARLLIMVSTRLIRWITRKPGRFVPEADGEQDAGGSRWKRALILCVIPMLAGLLLFSVSGLPVKYWMLFNSMKPQVMNVKTEEFDPAQVNKISLMTTHTNIRLVPGTGDKITVSCEQADWLENEIALNGAELSFKEKTNGRLPLFQLAQLHENSAELTVSIPKGYSPQTVDVESYGGFIYINALAENIKVRTVSGSIYLDNTNAEGAYNLKASTGTGFIEADRTRAGRKTDQGWEFDENNGAEKAIELSSVRGNIGIKPIEQDRQD